MATDTPPCPEQGVATLPDEAWERARRRAEIISPLAQSETVGHEAADMAAQALGLSRRQVYVLIRRARQGNGHATDLVPSKSGGGKGKGSWPEPSRARHPRATAKAGPDQAGTQTSGPSPRSHSG
ncbi:helix-turn-helix domain-containing protein, partial [Escherichia coli]|uniref:helix-turn-helix domain-containing protein n=1 Tax=Escherichia coli TaxID=562 RepID=UPI003D9BDF74